jgi:predicted metal-dependent phosphoesterase TrpH
MRIDLHTHSSISDGTDTPSSLVDRARQVGLDVVALTDHDTFAGLDEAVSRGKEVGVRVVRGVELSCGRVGESVHLLAYGADPASPALAAEMAKVRGGRMGRLAGVLQRLVELGVPVTEEQVLAEVGESPSVGRPHIADAMVKAGHVADRTEAFERFLADGGPAHVPRYAVPVERGIELVHHAGGVAVIAHPWGRGREQILPPEVLRRLTAEQGLDGLEVHHQDHDAETRVRLGALAAELGLLATGSSDYHGTGKLDHELGCNTTDPDVFDTLMDRLAARRVS